MKVVTADNKDPIIRKMHPGYTKFNLSHARKMSGDMGYLYPICILPVMPGDRVNINVEAVIRFMPMIAPVLHEVYATFDFYQVPYRIVDDTFVDFITGGEDGFDTTSPPRWTPTNINKTVEGNLWDHLGFPCNVIPSIKPVDWPRRAYFKIWNWHYRNINYQEEVDYESISGAEDLKLRNWPSDYFTSALPWQQRGIAPALPVSSSLDFTSAINGTGSDGAATRVQQGLGKLYMPNGTDNANLLAALNLADVDNTTFDIADLREAIQIQRFLEINARAGALFNDFLRGQYNVAPVDKTLQQPEFIGRVTQPIFIDEVMSNASTLTPSDDSPDTYLGQMAGKGISASQNFVGSTRVEEPGLIMGIMSVLPKAAYQQGIHRAWLIESKYDYPFPVFANLSEQIIKVGEIYCDGTDDNIQWPGDSSDLAFQGRYDEYRIMHDSVAGLMKKTTGGLAHWHMGRIFASQPALNSTFIQADCSTQKTRCMAVPSEDTFVANVGNLITCTRALPMFANPSIMENI